MTEQQLRTISVEDLFSSGKISRKTYFILLRARLRTAFDLKRYRSGLPRLFRNSLNGIKEVNNLLDEMDSSDKLPEMSTSLFPSIEPDLSRGELLLDRLSDDQKELLDLVYRRFLDNLLKTKERVSTRLANIMAQIPISLFIRDYLYEDDERILLLNEIGEASLPLLDTLKKDLIKVVDDIDNTDIPLQFRILQFQAGGTLDNDSFALQYYKKHRQLPILYLIQKYIIDHKSKQTFKAFLNRYDIFDGKVQLDFTEIKKSPFTITSYSNIVFDALFTTGASVNVLGHFLEELILGKWNKNGLAEIFNGSFVNEEDGRVTEIIEEQQLLMTPKCVVAILGKILSEKFHCLGGYSRSFGTALEGRWRHTYLVDMELAERIDFERELWLFRDTIVKESTDRIVFDFDDYLASRLNVIGYQGELSEIAFIIKKIAVGELQLEQDVDGNVTIPKMKDKTLADRLHIILDKRKQPMSLDELTETINSGDGRRYVRASVSLALNKDSRFKANGKKGLYALSEWNLPYFDSNANIVYKVLEEANRPMKSEEIVHIISQCPYNSHFNRSDLSSVFSLGKDKFVNLGKQYYGLVGREYPEDMLLTINNPFDIEKNSMMDFMDKNKRVPSINGDKDEAFMRAWFDRNRKQFEGNNSWNDEKRISFSKLVVKFDQLMGEESKNLSESQQEQPTVQDTESIISMSCDSHPIENIGLEKPIDNHSNNPTKELETEIVSMNYDERKEASSQEIVFHDDSGNNLHEEDILVLKQSTNVQQEQIPLAKENNESQWTSMMAEIWNFVRLNKREPLGMFTVEADIAEWLKKQKMALHKGTLSEKHREELIMLRDFLW